MFKRAIQKSSRQCRRQLAHRWIVINKCADDKILESSSWEVQTYWSHSQLRDEKSQLVPREYLQELVQKHEILYIKDGKWAKQKSLKSPQQSTPRLKITEKKDGSIFQMRTLQIIQNDNNAQFDFGIYQLYANLKTCSKMNLYVTSSSAVTESSHRRCCLKKNSQEISTWEQIIRGSSNRQDNKLQYLLDVQYYVS